MGWIQAVVKQGVGVMDIFQQRDANQAAFDTNAVELRRGWESEDMAAASAMQRGGHEAALARRRATQTVGAQRVAFAANGVDSSSGTAAKLAAATDAAGEEDADTIRANAIAEALGHKQTAQRYRTEKQRQAQAKNDAFSASIIKWETNTLVDAANFAGGGMSGGGGIGGGK